MTMFARHRHRHRHRLRFFALRQGLEDYVGVDYHNDVADSTSDPAIAAWAWPGRTGSAGDHEQRQSGQPPPPGTRCRRYHGRPMSAISVAGYSPVSSCRGEPRGAAGVVSPQARVSHRVYGRSQREVGSQGMIMLCAETARPSEQPAAAATAYPPRSTSSPPMASRCALNAPALPTMRT